MFVGICLGQFWAYKKYYKDRYQLNLQVKKKERLCKLLHKWLENGVNAKKLIDYLKRQGCSSVAVYGLAALGERFIKCLEETDIEVKYAIDRRKANIKAEVPVYSMDDELPDVDMIVVTAIYDFKEIEEELSDKMECTIISLEQIIYEM